MHRCIILVDVHLVPDSYEKARSWLRRAEDESELQTEMAATDDVPRKRRQYTRCKFSLSYQPLTTTDNSSILCSLPGFLYKNYATQ